MIFKNKIYLEFTDIYTQKNYDSVFYEEMYHLRKNKTPFGLPTNLNKIIQFFKFKDQNYLYINIPKVFFISEFKITIELDDDLVNVLELNSNTFNYNYIDKYYDNKLILFKDISIEINLSDSDIINNLMKSKLSDLHQIDITPTFIQYRIQEDFMTQNENIKSFQNDIFINLRNMVKKGQDITDYLLDYKVEKISNGLFTYEKFLKDNKLVVAICCSILVEYNLPYNFIKNYL